MKRSHTYKYKIASNDFTIYNTILIVHTNKLSHRKKWSENKLNENCGVLSSAGSSIIDSTSTQRHGVKEKRKSNFYWAGNKRQHQHYQHKKRVQHRLHDSATIIHWNHHFRRLSVWITFFFAVRFHSLFFCHHHHHQSLYIKQQPTYLRPFDNLFFLSSSLLVYLSDGF